MLGVLDIVPDVLDVVLDTVLDPFVIRLCFICLKSLLLDVAVAPVVQTVARLATMRGRGKPMFPLKSLYVWLVIGFLMLVLVGLVYSRMMQRMPRGEWGGTHISMDVGEHSATIEYDCATGEINGPLKVDDEGKFQLPGTFTPERGGPVRAGETPQSQPATYSGTINGNTMTLILKVSGVDETETFTLERGKPGRLVKCK